MRLCRPPTDLLSAWRRKEEGARRSLSDDSPHNREVRIMGVMWNSRITPIAHSHAICRSGLPLDWRFWQRHDRRYLEVCDEVVVLLLDGWQESIGVKAEIAIARELGKPVSFIAVRSQADAIVPA